MKPIEKAIEEGIAILVEGLTGFEEGKIFSVLTYLDVARNYEIHHKSRY
tara:strand:+ start:794 stop:940 length:147 start_codon:yes stop_codon:yes gene_type:complete